MQEILNFCEMFQIPKICSISVITHFYEVFRNVKKETNYHPIRIHSLDTVPAEILLKLNICDLKFDVT